MAAPRKRGEKEHYVPVQSLRAISESISRASGDPVVRAMSAGQTLALLANIFRLEEESLRER